MKTRRKKHSHRSLHGITDALEVVENAMPISNDSPQKAVLKEFSETVKQRTNDFKQPGHLSHEKIDMKPLLKQEGVTVAQWEATGNSLEFSEVDTVEYLASEIEKLKSDNGNKSDAKAKKMKMLKLKADAEAELIEILKL